MKAQFDFKYIVVTCLVLMFLACTGKETKIKDILLADLKDINSQCPMQLNTKIRLDSCMLLPNNDLLYHYTYTDSLAVDSLWFHENVIKPAKQRVKYDQAMEDIRSYGVYLYYKYHYPDGTEAYSYKITPEDYLQ